MIRPATDDDWRDLADLSRDGGGGKTYAYPDDLTSSDAGALGWNGHRG